MNITPSPKQVASTSKSTAADMLSQPQNDVREQSENYHTLSNAIAAKPAILKSILTGSEQDAITALKHGQPSKLDINERLSRAEKQYQAILKEQASELLNLFKNLPAQRKIDLLIEAEVIGEMNDKAREHARKHMQVSRAQALAAQHKDSAPETNKLPLQPAVIEPKITSPRIISPINLVSRQDYVTEIIRSIPAISPKIPAPATIPQVTSPRIRAPQQDDGTALLHGMATIAQEKNDGVHPLVGKPLATTISCPFNAIPGLSALTNLIPFVNHVAVVLKAIDKTSAIDLGFTVKGVADQALNASGRHDEMYRMSYIGIGAVSNKCNIQAAPIAVNLKDKTSEPSWGGSGSVLAKKLTDVVGTKVTLNAGSDDVGVSYAPETSLSSPSNKLVSSLTSGYHFGTNGPSLRITPDDFPLISRVVAALPDSEEMAQATEHIDAVVPYIVALDAVIIAYQSIKKAAETEYHAITAAKHLVQQELLASGLTAEQRVQVMACVDANASCSAALGKLPDVQIKDRNTNEVLSSQLMQLAH